MAPELPRDGDQLRLDLFADVPWDGRSPRALARGGSALYLRPEPPLPRGPFHDPEQLEFWPVDGHTERGQPSFRSAAPTLFKRLLKP